MKQAIVTGASSGIGLALSQFLTAEGYRVHGLARDFSKTEFTHPAFNPIVCDVRDIDVLQETAKAILEDAGSLHLLINNAGVAYFAPYETLSAGQVAEMADTNFRAPLLLTNLCLKALKESQGDHHKYEFHHRRDSESVGQCLRRYKSRIGSFWGEFVRRGAQKWRCSGEYPARFNFNPILRSP